ncbi:hypothetical protein [Streptomyces asiaticus]|uniref:hypothetical protein n=1 Tax=Streptomyces asiaticus TaxID=114695 RepID=UPI003F674FD6
MSSYRHRYSYRCWQCRIGPTGAHTRREALDMREEHRATAHSGHAPMDGDDIEGPPAPDARQVALTAAVFLVLGVVAWARITH